MNKNTDDGVILEYWNSTSQKVTLLYESAYKVLSANKDATFADLQGDEAFQMLSEI